MSDPETARARAAREKTRKIRGERPFCVVCGVSRPYYGLVCTRCSAKFAHKQYQQQFGSGKGWPLPDKEERIALLALCVEQGVRLFDEPFFCVIT
jgi:hypothetical protein